MSAVSPGSSRALVLIIRQAVSQATLSEAPWTKSSERGLPKRLPSGAETKPAKVPSTCSPKMLPREHRTSSPLRQNSQVPQG